MAWWYPSSPKWSWVVICSLGYYGWNLLFVVVDIIIAYLVPALHNDFTSGGHWQYLARRLNKNTSAITTMLIHLIGGTIVVVFGMLQLITPLRQQYPQLHRWLGRVYCLGSIAAGVGGLAFICVQHGVLVGGVNMTIAFTIYGILMIITPLMAWYRAYNEQLRSHKRWAIRSFALGIGAPLYRTWFVILSIFSHREPNPWHCDESSGRCSDFNRPLDQVNAWWFFVPNMIVAELFIHYTPAINAPTSANAFKRAWAACFPCRNAYDPNIDDRGLLDDVSPIRTLGGVKVNMEDEDLGTNIRHLLHRESYSTFGKSWFPNHAAQSYEPAPHVVAEVDDDGGGGGDGRGDVSMDSDTSHHHHHHLQHHNHNSNNDNSNNNSDDDDLDY